MYAIKFFDSGQFKLSDSRELKVSLLRKLMLSFLGQLKLSLLGKFMASPLGQLIVPFPSYYFIACFNPVAFPYFAIPPTGFSSKGILYF
jgi:hypothetical protein